MEMVVISIYCKRNLIHYIIYFYDQNGRFPTNKDFNSNPLYPPTQTYDYHFGSLEKAIETLTNPNGLYYDKFRVAEHINK